MSDPHGHCRFRAYAYWSSGLLNAGAEARLYRSLHHEWVLFFVQTKIEIAGNGFSISAAAPSSRCIENCIQRHG
jgi:hypothetical protein